MKKLIIALCCAATGHVCAQSFYPVQKGRSLLQCPGARLHFMIFR